MYHGQQQIALAPPMSRQGSHEFKYKSTLGGLEYGRIGERTPAQTPKTEEFTFGVPAEVKELKNTVLALRNVNGALREQLNQALDETKLTQIDMFTKLQKKLKDSHEAVDKTQSDGTNMDIKFGEIAATYETQNKLMKEQIKNFLKEAEARKRRIETLEAYNRALEVQALRPKQQQQENRYQSPGEPDMSIPGLEKWDRQGSGGNRLLNEVQSRPNTRDFTKTTDGNSITERQLRQTTERLESKMGDVLGAVEALTHRVASFQSNPPFEVTTPGAAALRKLNKSVDRIGAATDETNKVATKIAKLESTIAQLASSNILTTMVDNSKKQATSIFEISDALQNMEGKFDLLVKNVIHKVENIGFLIKGGQDQHQGEGNQIDTQSLHDITDHVESFKTDLDHIRLQMLKLDQKLDCQGDNYRGSLSHKAGGKSYTSLLTSDVENLRADINSIRREMTRTTVTPIKHLVENLLDRIAAISTYLVELKLQAFERSRGAPIKVSRWNDGWESTSKRRLPEVPDIDEAVLECDSNERCKTM